MCSIVGSFDKKTLRELIELNKYRGATRHSVMAVKYSDSHVKTIFTALGDGVFDDFDGLPNDCYYIAHHQAPTSRDSLFHPARSDSVAVFHNGIIKNRHIKVMQEELKSSSSWDTMLIAEAISKNGYSPLKTIDGSFACVVVTPQEITIFRNAIAPMFIDEKLNISSSVHPGYASIEAEKVWKLDLVLKTRSVVYSFDTCDNVFFFGE